MTYQEWDQIAKQLKRTGNKLFIRDIKTGKLLFTIKYYAELTELGDEWPESLEIFNQQERNVESRSYLKDKLPYNSVYFDKYSDKIDGLLNNNLAYIDDKKE